MQILKHVFARDLKHAVSAAKSRVRQRLTDGQQVGVDEILAACGIPRELTSSATRLLTGLSRAIGIEPGRFPSRGRLGDILHVADYELDDASRTALIDYGLKDGITVFHDDVLDVVQTTIDSEQWKRRRASLTKPPKNDDEWTDQILAMTVCEFLSFYSSLGGHADRS